MEVSRVKIIPIFIGYLKKMRKRRKKKNNNAMIIKLFSY